MYAFWEFWGTLFAASFLLGLGWRRLAKVSREWRAKVMSDGESGLAGDSWWGQNGESRARFDTAQDGTSEDWRSLTQRYKAEFVGQERSRRQESADRREL